jgi:hypothetical protein
MHGYVRRRVLSYARLVRCMPFIGSESGWVLGHEVAAKSYHLHYWSFGWRIKQAHMMATLRKHGDTYVRAEIIAPSSIRSNTWCQVLTVIDPVSFGRTTTWDSESFALWLANGIGRDKVNKCLNYCVILHILDLTEQCVPVLTNSAQSQTHVSLDRQLAFPPVH